MYVLFPVFSAADRVFCICYIVSIYRLISLIIHPIISEVTSIFLKITLQKVCIVLKVFLRKKVRRLDCRDLYFIFVCVFYISILSVTVVVSAIFDAKILVAAEMICY